MMTETADTAGHDTEPVVIEVRAKAPDGMATVEMYRRVVRRQAIDVLSGLDAIAGTSKNAVVRRVASCIIGGGDDVVLLNATVRVIERLAEDPDCRIVWADHGPESRHNGEKTDVPMRVQVQPGG